ncbi:hypothetical protein BGW42_007912 [Actinomortierella wolfii]|nr:hypothetical protein BGW42_007912 [Actinomortierella wolfii]
MSLETSTAVWAAFRADPAGDHYLPESHIVFLPTGTGAANESLIRKFYQSGAYSHPKKLSVQERVIHRTVGVSSAVDEVEVTVKFVNGSGGWLLPGIEPHFLEDIVVTFPMVICGSIDQGKIASVRYLWDNAAVLKMAHLIGSRNSWPIVAEVQVDALREPSRFRLNPYGDPIGASGNNTHIKSNISSIFNATPPSEPSPSIRSTLASPGSSTPSAPPTPRKGHPALTSTAFDYLKNAPSPFLEHEAERKLGYMAAHTATGTPFSSSPPSSSSAAASSFPSPSSSSSSTAISPTTRHGHSQRGHPALTSKYFDNHSGFAMGQNDDDLRPSSPPSHHHHHQIPHRQETAGSPRAKKGHPALTSQINFGAPPPEPAPRQFRKVPDNIFGHLIQQEQDVAVARQTQVSPPPLPLPLSLPADAPSNEEPREIVHEYEGDGLTAEITTTMTTTTTTAPQENGVEQQLAAIRLGDDNATATAETPLTPPPEQSDSREAPQQQPAPTSSIATTTVSSTNTTTTTSSTSSLAPARRVHPNYRSQISFG